MSPASAAIQRAEQHLITADPAFTDIVRATGPCTIGSATNRDDPFTSLVTSIVSQQLSTGAARTITGRLITSVGGTLAAESLSALSSDAFRVVGLSAAKTRTIQELAQQVTTGDIDLNYLSTRATDEEIMAQLTALWGIGPWTVHMFMMFTLARLDVWPTGDLGVRKGWQLVHGQTGDPGPRGFADVAVSLRPFRSVAAWYCWRQLESQATRTQPG